MEKPAPYRQPFEKDGTLHIVIGVMIGIVGLAMLVTGTFVLGLLLAAVGVWMVVYGVNRRAAHLRRDAPAKPNPHAEPSATE